MATSCPACLAENTRKWGRKNDFLILKCNSCGHGFVDPMPEPSVLAELYDEQSYGTRKVDAADASEIKRTEELYPNATLDAERMLRTAKAMLNNSELSMLDVGCGYGFSSRTAKELGMRATALEISSNGRNMTKEIAELDPVPSTFDDFTTEDKFDIILMSQVVEHVSSIDTWAKKASDVMTDNGILVMAMPNFNNIVALLLRENDPYIAPPMHVNYFTPRSATSWLNRSGFDHVTIKGVSRLGPRTVIKRLPFLPENRGLISFIRFLQDIPFRLFGLMGFPIMLNVYARRKK
ncbi:hypothetical protein BVX94_00595 [bacterium B17]|nr:hypothetical protein BVX94_00595 [bacterium B17]